ncbi:MAG: hypothetical protein ACUVWX_02750 [Kiritimatiellia bacterium]
MLERVKVRPARVGEEERCERLLKRHHYLGAARPVGELLYYVAVSPYGGWIAVIPNVDSRVLRLTTDRLSDDWQQRYGHPLCFGRDFC